MNWINEVLSTLTWINLVILALGSYSITRLIVTDSFPLFEKPRKWILERFPAEGHASQIKPKRGTSRRTSNNIYIVEEGHWLGELISCPWCSGWWVSLAIWVAFMFIPEIVIIGLVPFALRAFVGGYANKIGGG